MRNCDMLKCSNEKAYPNKTSRIRTLEFVENIERRAVVLRGVVYSSWRDWRCFTKLTDVEWDAWGEAKSGCILYESCSDQLDLRGQVDT